MRGGCSRCRGGEGPGGASASYTQGWAGAAAGGRRLREPETAIPHATEGAPLTPARPRGELPAPGG